jgi:Xaa-Pro aminopeptidase
VLLEARATKDPTELKRMRHIQKQTTEIVGQVADFLSSQRAKDGILVDKDGKPVTVGNVKAKINLWIAERGLDNPDGTIFAPGAEGGVPHSMGSADAVLRLGEPIVFDIFPKEAGGGYWADFTRTWCLGHATDKAQALYDDVRFVFDTLMSEIRADERCAVFQARTCELFKQRGHPTVLDDPTTKVGTPSHTASVSMCTSAPASMAIPRPPKNSCAADTLSPSSRVSITPSAAWVCAWKTPSTSAPIPASLNSWLSTHWIW